jgi:hypothetical protein
MNTTPRMAERYLVDWVGYCMWSACENNFTV